MRECQLSGVDDFRRLLGMWMVNDECLTKLKGCVECIKTRTKDLIIIFEVAALHITVAITRDTAIKFMWCNVPSHKVWVPV